MKKLLFITLSVFILLAVGIALFNQQTQPNHSTKPEINSDKPTKILVDKQQPNTLSTSLSTQTSHEAKTKTQVVQKSSPNLNFDDETSVDNFMQNSQGAVKQDALQEIFVDDNFAHFIKELKEVEQSDLAIARAHALQEKLNALNSSDYEFACAGKVCALELNYQQLSDEQLAELEEFSSHYVFNNPSTNEYGENTLKAVYIHTLDPSTLQLEK